MPKKHQIIIAIFGILLLVILVIPDEDSSRSYRSGLRYSVPLDLNDAESTVVAVTGSAAPASPQQSNQVIPRKFSVENTTEKVTIAPMTFKEKITHINKNITWQTATVKSGDSLAKVLKRFGFNASTTHSVSHAKGEYTNVLVNLSIGDVLHIGKNENNLLTAIEYPISKTDTLYVQLLADGTEYQSNKESKEPEIIETFAHGSIQDNFWNAGAKSGLDDGKIMELANIFGWDIDFALDIRPGDTFHVVYEKRYIDGEYIGSGKILSAEFFNQGDTFQAVRFTDGEFYTPDGKSMRKAFLRAPVNFKYISSSFKLKRFHPVQKRWKAHRGIDYAAKPGTPVVAAGNGTVTHSTYNKYNGNYVFIQHGNGIVTKYLHFTKRKVKKGQRVKQNQIIGTVGSTGLASGPHLHYEFLLHGVHRNPRTVKLPDAKPINAKFKKEFLALSAKRVKLLEGSKNALNSVTGN